MYQNLLFNASFHLFLTQIDREFAEEVKQAGCPDCGGTLHLADYPRSPVGVPPPVREHYERRLSFCCSRCRTRVTPPSVRFFGRRWYPAPVFIFISALRLGISDRRLAQIKKHIGITANETTWKRWRRWWREFFWVTPFWQQAKGLLPPHPKIIQGCFPRVLLNIFNGPLEEKMRLLLKFLSPLTTRVFRIL
jgi:hypothetical protein